MNVIDTTIWIYSHDTRDPQKQLIAQGLIATLRPLSLPWQVGCEFVAAARKLSTVGFDEDKAWSGLADMEAMANDVLLPSPQLWQETQRIQKAHMLSFWDALLVATCIQAKVTALHPENMGSPRQIEGLALVNPFQQSARP